MKFTTTLIPTLFFLCIATIGHLVFGAEEGSPAAVVTGIEGAIMMGKDDEGNPIYVGNKVNYGTEGATMMMVSRDAIFNMVASACETMTMHSPLMVEWMQHISEQIEEPTECSVQTMKIWWDALCGEYSMAKQHSYFPGSEAVVRRRHALYWSPMD